MDRRLYQWAEKTVSGLGYEFVHLEWVGRGGLLRLFIDKEQGIGVEDCAFVSDQLTRAMAVEGFSYDRLEVSSPGLDRPLVKISDFQRFCGQEVRLRLRVPVGGRRNFSGTLASVSGSSIRIETSGTEFLFEFGNIDKARLVPQL